MNSISSVNQPVLRNVDFELSYRRRRYEVIRFVLQLSNNEINENDQVSSGNFYDDKGNEEV